jgi:hypothetical protein
MNVLVRSKPSESIRRRREGFRESGTDQVVAPVPAPTKVRPPAAVASNDVRREGGTCSGRPLTNDAAMYHCQCGYVFEAPVSTSVGCPHCGGTQAW